MHYWDGERQVGRAYQPILGTPEEAWDVWMLFRRGAVWEGEVPPQPTWWEHQLYGVREDLMLQPDRFTQKARELGGQR